MFFLVNERLAFDSLGKPKGVELISQLVERLKVQWIILNEF